MFDETKHPRDSDGKFTNGNGEISNLPSAKRIVENYERQFGEIKMTPEQKIASVHIDFNKDNVLPELNDDTIEKLGLTENKSVLLKKSIIDRNHVEHSDISDNDMESIIKQALYNPNDVFPANSKKPYFHLMSFIGIGKKGEDKIGLLLLDVDIRKEKFEIVHVHFVDIDGLQRARKKVQKKD